ncbi:MAG: hypothetical protein P8N76_26980 [Pirellulaceae bacterium]|nr:hypothetical protein [Pirellulaceae bacterium]
MLRRPDFKPNPAESRSSRRRILLTIVALSNGLLALAWISPLGTLFGLLASLLAIALGLFAGWFLTYVIRLPRDGRGFHERFEAEKSGFLEAGEPTNFP